MYVKHMSHQETKIDEDVPARFKELVFVWSTRLVTSGAFFSPEPQVSLYCCLARHLCRPSASLSSGSLQRNSMMSFALFHTQRISAISSLRRPASAVHLRNKLQSELGNSSKKRWSSLPDAAYEAPCGRARLDHAQSAHCHPDPPRHSWT